MRDAIELAGRLARVVALGDVRAIDSAGAALLVAGEEALAAGDPDRATAIAELAIAMCRLGVDAAFAGGQRSCPAA